MLASMVLVAATIGAAPALAQAPPGSQYAWEQPWGYSQVLAEAQLPPAPFVAGTAYVWAQPPALR